MKSMRLLLLALLTLLTTTAQADGSPASDTIEKISEGVRSFFGQGEAPGKNACKLKIRHWQAGSTYHHPRFTNTDARMNDTATSWQECYTKALAYSEKYEPAVAYDYTYKSGKKERVIYHAYTKWHWQEHEGAVTVYTPMSTDQPQEGDQRVFHKAEEDPPNIQNEYFSVVPESVGFLPIDQY